MKKILFLLLLLFLITSLIIIVYPRKNFFKRYFLEIKTNLANFTNSKEVEFQESEKLFRKVILPPPLKITEREKTEVFLEAQNIIEWTNRERKKYNIPELKENQKLNQTAKAKLEDMFKEQYFSHYSPSGKGITDLAKTFNYEFLIIGENLAMGNFSSEEDLVEAWMESQGHRENILNPNYQEIGVAVEEGIFEGKKIWLAVQHFALPLSYCPQPDLSLKEEIKSNQKQISELKNKLSSLKSEIEISKKLQKEEYSQKIAQYNNLVSQYNTLIEKNRNLINQYNSKVNSFNQCLNQLVR
jgi:uncharacterized protein YkwD